MRVVFWGTYDLGKPRNRILMQGLRDNGVEVIECHRQLWQGVEDKSQIKGIVRRIVFGIRWLLAYPSLLIRYLRLPRHDLVLVGYVGQLDVLVLRPWCWLRGVPLVWDTFLSVHDTVVSDRRLVRPLNPLAWLLWGWEWLALRAADLLLVDTRAHGRYFSAAFGVAATRIERVFVGAEPQAFFPATTVTPPQSASRPYRVLFYGQFIPLHGMETIAHAARLCADEDIHWEVIGDGQDTARFHALIDRQGLQDLHWTPWVPYLKLIEHIHAADLCLGIFGKSDKASRVIPNKVFQILAAGRALITADTPAIRELLEPGPGIILVPPGDPQALAAAIREMRGRCPVAAANQLATYRARITPAAIGKELAAVLGNRFVPGYGSRSAARSGARNETLPR